jgi:hypothetical protein
MSTVQLPPEIEYKDSGYVARVVVFALMCFGCFISLLLWIGEVRRMLYACYPPAKSPLWQWAAHKVLCKPI